MNLYIFLKMVFPQGSGSNLYSDLSGAFAGFCIVVACGPQCVTGLHNFIVFVLIFNAKHVVLMMSFYLMPPPPKKKDQPD